MDVILAETTFRLSRVAKENLPYFRLLGNFSAHGKFFYGRKEDVNRFSVEFRAVIEELLRHAKLI